MNGIKMSFGTIFVTDGLFTVRLLPTGECAPSPITYRNVEWDLRTEREDTWEYITESDIRALPDGAYEKIQSLFEKMHRRTNT